MFISGEGVLQRWRESASDDEDGLLWQAAVAGDEAAFDRLVTRHCGKIASVAARFLNDPNEIEDVVQETFIQAFETRARHPELRSVRAWLLRIAINACKSRQRACWWRRTQLTGDLSPRFWGSQEAPGQDPHDLAERSLVRRQVEQALSRLPEALQVPFILRYFEELSGAEIAVVLGCNESTVWSRIYTARRELKRRLPVDLILTGEERSR